MAHFYPLQNPSKKPFLKSTLIFNVFSHFSAAAEMIFATAKKVSASTKMISATAQMVFAAA